MGTFRRLLLPDYLVGSNLVIAEDFFISSEVLFWSSKSSFDDLVSIHNFKERQLNIFCLLFKQTKSVSDNKEEKSEVCPVNGFLL